MRRLWSLCIIVVAILASTARLDAYNFLAARWPTAGTVFYVNIPGANGLWNSAFEGAMFKWNDRTVFTFGIVRTYDDPCSTPDRNGVAFTANVCGTAWGASTLAVTRSYWVGDTKIRAEMNFNNNRDWDVFNSSIFTFFGQLIGVSDFRRVATHELGHALGLDHEDDVASIMHTYYDDTLNPQNDDIEAVRVLYSVRDSGNNDFENRYALAGSSGTTVGSNLNATTQTGEVGNGSRSVWWRLSAVSGGQLTVNTDGSSFDTTLQIFREPTSAAVNNLTLLDSNDDYVSGSSASRLSIAITGGFNYAIRVAGYSGNSGKVVLNYSVAADNTPSTITVSSHLPGAYVAVPSVTLAGTARDTTTGVTSVTVNGVRAANDTATPGANANWSRAITLTPGLNAIAIVATDGAGNRTTLYHYLNYDDAPPVLAITSHSDGMTVTTPAITLRGTARDGTSGVVSVAVNGTRAASDTAGPTVTANWSLALTLVTGQNRLTVVTTDGASRTTTVTITLTYDATPPVLTLTNYRSGDLLRTAAIILSGTARANGSGIVSVTVNGTRATSDTASGTNTASWSRALTLNVGANPITVVATDGSGRTSTSSLTLTFDGVPPALTISSHSSGAIVTRSAVILSGTARDATTGIVSVTVNGVRASSDTATGSNTANWSRALTLTPGSNPLTVVSTDGAGNTTTASVDLSYNSSGFGFFVKELGGHVVTPLDQSSTLATGYGEVDPGTDPSPSGMAIIANRQNGVVISEAAVPTTPPILNGRIFAEIGGGVNTGVAIANPNAATVNLELVYRDADGTALGTRTTSIVPNGQFAAFLNEAPLSAPSNFRVGTMTFAASAPVAAIALRGFTNERSEFLMTTLPVAKVETLSSAGLSISHFADGDGWTTQLILINPGSTTLTGEYQWTAPSGAPVPVTLTGTTCPSSCVQSRTQYFIPPGGAISLKSAGTGALRTGSIQVVPSGDAPVATAIFGRRSGGVTVSEASVQAVVPSNLFRLFIQNGSDGQPGAIRTGLAVAAMFQDTQTTSMDLQLILTDLSGFRIGARTYSLSRTVGQAAFFLDEYFQLGDFRGILEVSSTSCCFSVVGLRGRVNQRGDFLISTTAPVAGESAARGEQYFPHFAVGGGYRTDFVLFGGAKGSTGAGILSFIGTTGQIVNLPTQATPIEPAEKRELVPVRPPG